MSTVQLGGFTDDIVEGVCKQLLAHRLVDKAKLKALRSADAPSVQSIERWGVHVRLDRKLVDKVLHGFAYFEFVTPDDLHVHKFEIDLNRTIKMERRYLEGQFIKLKQSLDSYRKERQQAQRIEIADRQVVAPTNGQKVLTRVVHGVIIEESLPKPTHAAPSSRH